MNLEEFAARIPFYKENPIAFFTEILDVKKEYVWSKMEEIANSVRDHQNTCVKAGHSVSKSYTVARVALWFLYTHYPSTVITTAPSHPQVQEILWREIRSAHSNAKVKLGGTMTQTKLEIDDRWFAFGFSTKPDTADSEATKVQGFHNDNVLVLFDEGPGIHSAIWRAKDALITTPRHKFATIGNPTMARGEFADCFKNKHFNKITVSVLDTPNYKQGREVIPGLSGREFEQQIIDKYGKDSNIYKARVIGEIPDEDVDALIPLSWIEKAEGAKVYHNFRFIKKFVVWDVADGGDDSHVIKAFENTTEIDSVEIKGKNVEEVEPYVWRLLRQHGGNAIVVDNDGIGRVAVGLLNASSDNKVMIIPFEGSSRDVNEPETFFNRRHEAHWKMRELFEKHRISISVDAELREELASIKLVDHTRGYIAIEPKKDLKERLGRSPDKGDCIMMMAGAFDEIPILTRESSKYPRIDEQLASYPFTPETV